MTRALLTTLLALALVACDSRPATPPQDDDVRKHLERTRPSSSSRASSSRPASRAASSASGDPVIGALTEGGGERLIDGVARAVQLRAQGKHREAIELIESLRPARRDSAEAQLLAGRCHQDLGEIAQALACWRRTLAADPDEHRAHLLLGAALVNAGELAAARPHLAAVARRHPEARERDKAASVLARIDEQLGQADIDRKVDQALTKDLASLRERRNAAVRLASAGRHDEAIKGCLALTSDFPADVRSHQLLAKCYYLRDGAGDQSRAQAQIEIVLTMQLTAAELGEALLIRAQSYVKGANKLPRADRAGRQRAYKQALADFERALKEGELQPDSARSVRKVVGQLRQAVGG